MSMRSARRIHLLLQEDDRFSLYFNVDETKEAGGLRHTLPHSFLRFRSFFSHSICLGCIVEVVLFVFARVSSIAFGINHVFANLFFVMRQ